MEKEEQFRDLRLAMVRDQIERRGIHDPRLLDVMQRVPRHRFIPPDFWSHAYEDRPLPIGLDQTISQPYIVAAMTDLLALQGDENVLEIGTGSGYQAAVLAMMARSVHTIERHVELAKRAKTVLEDLEIANVFVHAADGTLGWQPAAPYQAILVTAAAPEIPAPLVEQLAEGGRLVIPIGNQFGQDLERWQKTGGNIYRERLFPVTFVPLRGRYGWQRGWDSQ